MARSAVVNLANFQQFTAINVLSDPGHIGGPVVVPQCAQFSFVWALESGHVGHNVLYGRYSGGYAGSTAQCNSIALALTTGATWTALAGFLATSTQFVAVTVRDVNTAGAALIGSSITGVPGTSASPALPNEVALAVTERTAKAGRGFRGRFYVPGYATNALGAGNVVAAAAMTATQNWANLITGAFAAQGYTLVLGLVARAQYTGKTGVVHPARAATSEAVTATLVRDNHWDSQRRRGLK
jgi:hypothetical protein